jgi:hypothetical protein
MGSPGSSAPGRDDRHEEFPGQLFGGLVSAHGEHRARSEDKSDSQPIEHLRDLVDVCDEVEGVATDRRDRAQESPIGPERAGKDETRSDRINNAGQVNIRHDDGLHHIGIGPCLPRTCVRILIVQDRQVRVVIALTGEI